MTQYITTETQSLDPAVLYQELVAAIGSKGWYINTAGKTVDVIQTDMSLDLSNAEAVILAHFDNGPVRDLSKAKSNALTQVDFLAGQTRSKYITTTPGQAEIYILKAQQAQAFKDSGYDGDVPVLVQVEATVTGETVQVATDSILAQQYAWEIKGAQIEQVRRAGKIAVGLSTTLEDVATALNDAIVAFATL